MRICPTGVIQPAALEAGLEGLWTPVLDFRMGTSGCQHNCIACGHLCPTSAIRPLSFDERFGRKAHEKNGPVRIGTAFIDRGRCLPWAMDKPCIVCQENCPVSPKAIFTREHYSKVRFPNPLTVKTATPLQVVIDGATMAPGRFETGDYYCFVEGAGDADFRRILENGADRLEIHPKNPWRTAPLPGSRVEIQIRLQQPYVDIDRCIGCGICEHECPVSGKRAIRVTAENESRHPKHALTFAKTQGTQAVERQ
jgi:ferredoxin